MCADKPGWPMTSSLSFVSSTSRSRQRTWDTVHVYVNTRVDEHVDEHVDEQVDEHVDEHVDEQVDEHVDTDACTRV